MKLDQISEAYIAMYQPKTEEQLDELSKPSYVSAVKQAVDPDDYGDKDHQVGRIIKLAEKQHGSKFAKDLTRAAEISHFPRHDIPTGYDALQDRKANRVNASGKVNKQDVSALKSRIKSNLKTEDFEEMSLEEFELVIENYDQLDELSKDTLKSYLKKSDKEVDKLQDDWSNKQSKHAMDTPGLKPKAWKKARDEFHSQPDVTALRAKLLKRTVGGNVAYKKLDEATKTPFEVGEHHGYNNTDPLVRRQAIAKYKEGSAEHDEYKKGVAAGNERRSSIGKQYRA